jgi:hypothetical protein
LRAELNHRWRQPGDPIGAAVIPPGLLQRLCEEYLTGAQRASANPGWFDSAVKWACRPVRGQIAPLAAAARRVGQLDGYVVNDILVHDGVRRYNEMLRVPDKPWEVLVADAGLDACEVIGMQVCGCRECPSLDRAARAAGRTRPRAVLVVADHDHVRCDSRSSQIARDTNGCREASAPSCRGRATSRDIRFLDT